MVHGVHERELLLEPPAEAGAASVLASRQLGQVSLGVEAEAVAEVVHVGQVQVLEHGDEPQVGRGVHAVGEALQGEQVPDGPWHEGGPELWPRDP